MNKLFTLFSMYIAAEVFCYISHSTHYSILNSFKYCKKNKHTTDKRKLQNCVKTLKHDMINHMKNMCFQVNCILHNNSGILTKSKMYDIIKYCMYFPYHNSVSQCNHIDDVVKVYEKNNSNGSLKIIKSNENFNANFHISKNTKKTIIHDNELVVWYKPLPIILMFESIVFYTDLTMLHSGFSKVRCSNGLVLWYRKGTKYIDNCITFVHGGAGGIVFHMELLKKIPREYSLLVPELPGISFGNRVYIPPTVRQMSRSIAKFIVKNNMKKLQLMSHSFGGNIVSCVINNYHNYFAKNNVNIINTTLVEPIIFMSTLPFISKILTVELNNSEILYFLANDKLRLMSYWIMFRDIYIQHYSKCFTILDCLLGITEYEKNNTINIVLSENDELVNCDECVTYLKNKQYRANIKIFQDNMHGAFCFDGHMQSYAVSLLKN